MSKHSYGMRNTGMASIVLIFAVLCLTVFSTLSYMTAYREQQLTEKMIAATERYYEADWCAEEYYEQIENSLLAGMSPVEIANAQENLRWDESERIFAYEVAIDDNQELQVKLMLLDNNRLRVSGWKTVATGQWEYNTDIRVWDGENGD